MRALGLDPDTADITGPRPRSRVITRLKDTEAGVLTAAPRRART